VENAMEVYLATGELTLTHTPFYQASLKARSFVNFVCWDLKIWSAQERSSVAERLNIYALIIVL
jgi:hypothetical protein